MKKCTFKLENQDCYLAKLLKNINKKNYIWFLEFDDVHKCNFDFLFEEEIYSNQDFWNIIENNIDYFIIHLHLFLYENEIQQEKNIPLLELDIADCEFVDVYFNDTSIEKILRKNIEKIIQELSNENNK